MRQNYYLYIFIIFLFAFLGVNFFVYTNSHIESNKKGVVNVLGAQEKIVTTQVKSSQNCVDTFIGTSYFLLGKLASPVLTDGTVVSIKGFKNKIYTQVHGCPVKVWITDGTENYDLIQDEMSGLWTGEFMLSTTGKSSLNIYAQEVSGRTLSRQISNIFVFDTGKLEPVDQNSAEVKLFFRDTPESDWILWNGEELGQQNPFYSKDSYAFIVGPGEYYLEINKANKQTMYSKIFKLETQGVIAEKIIFHDYNFLSPVLSKFQLAEVQPFEVTKIYSGENLLTGVYSETISELELVDREGKYLFKDLTDKKPTLLTFLNEWAISSDEQNLELNHAIIRDTEDSKFNFLQVVHPESFLSIESKFIRGDYSFNLFALNDYNDIEKWKIIMAPQHFFIDGEGNIREVVVGKVLSTEEILDKLNQIISE